MAIQEIIRTEKQLSKVFLPQDAKLYNPSSLQISPHYSLIIQGEEKLSENLARCVDELTGRDASLACNPPENYHVTVFTTSLASDPQKIRQTCTNLLASAPLQSRLQGLHIRPLGIAVNAYATDDGLARLRTGLAEKFGAPFIAVPERLRHIGWITLARFTAPPPQSLISYVLHHMDQDFGKLTSENLHLYKTAHRQLFGAVKIW